MGLPCAVHPPLAKGVCHETFDVARGDRRGARAPCRAGRLRSGFAAEQPAGKDDDLQCGCEGEGLMGAERKAFMKSCLSEKGAETTAGASTSATGASGSADRKS